MQNRLGITGRLLAAFKHQITGCLESNGVVKVSRHRPVGRITGILPVDHRGHLLHGLHDLGPGDHLWRSQLAMCWLEIRKVARSSIRPTLLMSGTLEQPDALIDPAHHIAENALGIVVELVLDFLAVPVRTFGANGMARISSRLAVSRVCQLLLDLGHIDLVIVLACSVAAVGDGTQAVLAPAFGWPIFCSSMSAIRSGIAHMPLPIWACPGRPHSSPISTFQSLIGVDPGGCLHVGLADHRTGFHGGVNLVAGTIKEAGIDEEHTRCVRRECIP